MNEQGGTAKAEDCSKPHLEPWSRLVLSWEAEPGQVLDLEEPHQTQENCLMIERKVIYKMALSKLTVYLSSQSTFRFARTFAKKMVIS